MDGADEAAPAEGPVQLSEQEEIELRNNKYSEDAKKHDEEKKRMAQMEADDEMDYNQAAWYEASGGQQRTGPAVGYGCFDSDLSKSGIQAERWGRNYRDVDAQGQKRWTALVENMWEENHAGRRKAAQEAGGTYRLFKARW
jgi:hypothetical protein